LVTFWYSGCPNHTLNDWPLGWRNAWWIWKAVHKKATYLTFPFIHLAENFRLSKVMYKWEI